VECFLTVYRVEMRLGRRVIFRHHKTSESVR
jgi:hypothetical protein